VGAGEVVATIDTLRLAKRFKEAKLTEEQAELLAETFRETREAELAQMATKADLALLREELVRRIDGVAADLGRRIDGVEAKLDGIEARLTVRLGGMLAAVVLVGALVAIF
jgi:multidrug resistance efflux pump